MSRSYSKMMLHVLNTLIELGFNKYVRGMHFRDKNPSNPNLNVIACRSNHCHPLSFFLETHITMFKDYVFICHMENEERKTLMSNISSITFDHKKMIEIRRGAGKIGREVFELAEWRNKYKNYFNRYFKTSNFITMPFDMDIVMDTFSQVCSRNGSRGFVFKNYDMRNHLEFLEYNVDLLKAELAAAVKDTITSYIVYSEHKNLILLCNKFLDSCNTKECLKHIATFIKCFLFLHNKKFHKTGVHIIGLMIKKDGDISENVECDFCNLFSPLYNVFESSSSLIRWWNFIEAYSGWWDLASPYKSIELFNELAAEILCFMAIHKKDLPPLTSDKSQQFKQTYFIYTPQQLSVCFSDLKHTIIKGSYGSGKSIVGLKKLELIAKICMRHEKIIYINFDSKSKLHILMENNVRKHVRIFPRKIKCISSIREILDSLDASIYVCHNSEQKNFSAILEEIIEVTLKKNELKFHAFVEEYDGETLTRNEAAHITELVRTKHFEQSNILILVQPLTKNRKWHMDSKIYERETSMFQELKKVFKIVKLEEVLRCSNEICNITKSAQKLVQDKESIFKPEMGKFKLKKLHKFYDHDDGTWKHGEKGMNHPDFTISNNERVSHYNSANITNKIHEYDMNLDEAFEKVSANNKGHLATDAIVSRFGFLSQPRQGVDINGGRPTLVEFSESINSTNDVGVISLALVLFKLTTGNRKTTLLHVTKEKPVILRKAIIFLNKYLATDAKYTESIEECIKENRHKKMIFLSNFQKVNGMEFDHVVVLVSHAEYYLKYYLPQLISRCRYDLSFVLLPNERQLLYTSETKEIKETVGDMIEEWKHKSLMKQINVVECDTCEEDSNYNCISSEADNMLVFGVHTWSDHYQTHLSEFKENLEFREQTPDTSDLAGYK